MVDSGSHACYFRADVGEAVGLKVEKGAPAELVGIKKGLAIPVFFHTIRLILGSESLTIPAGFTPELSVAGVLGRRGFFDNFSVRFDSASSPPSLEIERIHHA